MIGFEENEISTKANGGTEIAKRRLAELIPEKLLSEFQIICSRHREFNWEKIRIFWCHDLPEDPESKKFKDKSFLDSIHKFVFISNWQLQRYQLFHGYDFNDRAIVLESGIDPASENAVEKSYDKIKLVYTSTPQRGLELLVPVFEELCKTNPDIVLHVFSSFKIYGWDEADKTYEPLYDRIRNHPKMVYHGFQSNNLVKAHLESASILAYPSTWIETSCRSMLEAMSAGLVCVHPNLGALPETSGGLNIMYHWSQDNLKHSNDFGTYLKSAINFVRNQDHLPMIKFNKAFVDSRYNIDRIKFQWISMLNELKKEYPTIESRAKPKDILVYRTS